MVSQALDLAASLRAMRIQSDASDISSPNNNAKISQAAFDQLLRYADLVFQREVNIGGRKSFDIQDFLEREKEKTESDTRAAIRRIAEERVAIAERIAAITERVERVQELGEKARKATVIVGEMLEIPASELSPDDTLGEIILRVDPETFGELVDPNTPNGNTNAEAFLGATSAVTEHAVETSAVREDLEELKVELAEQQEKIIGKTMATDIGMPATVQDVRIATQDFKTLTAQVEKVEEQIKDVVKQAPASPISTAVVAATREEITAQVNPKTHKRCCTEFNKLNESYRILVEIGFLKENGREITEKDLQQIYKDAEKFEFDAKEFYFTRLAKVGEKELDLTSGEIDVSQMHEMHRLSDQIIKYGPDKIKELMELAQEKAQEREAQPAADEVTTFLHIDKETGKVTPETFTAAHTNLPPASLRDFTAAIEEFRNSGIIDGNVGATTFTYDKDGHCTVSHSCASAAKTFAASGVLEVDPNSQPTTPETASASLKDSGASPVKETVSATTPISPAATTPEPAAARF